MGESERGGEEDKSTHKGSRLGPKKETEKKGEAGLNVNA